MFTGLIEEVGKVNSIKRSSSSFVINISGDKVISDIKIGDSISVNGVCLTVTEFETNNFTAYVMPETYQITTLKHLNNGATVNLERAMKLGDRFGGHMVSGHVDSIGVVKKIVNDENAIRIRINADDNSLKYMIRKGSIAIEGISLTIVDVFKDSFEVSIIPETLKSTTLSEKKIGDLVNLECDLIGKYVERLLSKELKNSSNISEQLLYENGFI